MMRAVRSIIPLVLAVVVASSCASQAPVDVVVRVDPGVEMTLNLARLDYRVFTVQDVDEIVATATNPNGSSVQAVSCEVLATAAPDATGCTEAERRVTRDQDLIESGNVPADGLITVDGSSRIRVYATLPSDQLRMDESGRICAWNGDVVIEPGSAPTTLDVQPFC